MAVRPNEVTAEPPVLIDKEFEKKLEKEAEAGFGDHPVTVSAADGPEPHLVPTAEDLATLPRISAAMPMVGLMMCLIEFAERASYYGTSGPFNNFINNPLPIGGNGAGAVAKGPAGLNQSAGALGQGSVTASAVTKMFSFLAYVIPIMGGIVADNHWGRFKTICVGTAVGAVAHVILVIPAIPQVLAVEKAALSVFIISIIILACAAGFIKPSLAPLLCDQAPVKQPTLHFDKKGNKVIIDPQATVSRYLNIFYLCINIGALFQLATQYAARDIGFWLAFLLPGIIYMLMPVVLIYAGPRLVKLPPTGSVIPDTFRVIKRALSARSWDAARPSYIREKEGFVDESVIHWDDKFVEEIRQTLSACGVFMFIPIFQLADIGSVGLGNIGNDMSTAMILNGVPNDLINNFNSISIIVFSPIVTYGLYPFMEKIGWPLKPMTRMTIGFFLASIGCMIGTIVQNKIYQTSDCGKFATNCVVNGETRVSDVSLWVQLPIIILPAIGELFVNVTSYELAYTRSPPRMRGLVYSLSLFNTAIASAISLACSKALTDPNLVIAWGVLTGCTFVCCFVFPTFFRHLNDFNFEWSSEEKEIKTEVEARRLSMSEESGLSRPNSNAVPRLRDDEKY